MADRRLQDGLLFGLRATATLLLMTLCSLIMLGVAVPTLFQARRLYHERIATLFARLMLALWGIRLELHQSQPFPLTQTIYISNHTSTIDMFVLLALGFPNTRFFLSGFLRKLLPLGLIGYLMGIFWTVDQKFPEKRVRIFKRAEAILRHTGESVFLSPEGERVTSGVIGHFNKGAFHLATNLKVPIVPIYIAIPRAMDPGIGLRAKPGTVRVYVKPAVSTQDWRLEDLRQNKEKVRNLFIQWQREHKS
jgi:1-acyl-sn-glycerol-3-phosphate acyltransferase